MGTIYLRQRIERAILKNAEEDVSDLVNDTLEGELISRGWLEPPGEEA